MSRESFYNGKTWKLNRVSFARSKNCICERCGKPVWVKGISDESIPKERRLKYIVHHKTYLNDINLNDDTIALDWNNLELLCINCHNQEHVPNTAIRKDLMFDEFGNVVQRKVIKRTPD